MHESGDSGISAVLLAIAIAVLVTFAVVQQARARAARYQEIRRLQYEAAEEARREEAAADAEYTSMVATRNYCAVCLNPTTTRCSRCKAVRYCSSTCQVQHWKQGHKQECRAPDALSPGSSSNVSRDFSEVFSSNASSRNGSRTLSEVSDGHGAEDAAPAEVPRISSSWTGNGTPPRYKEVLFPYDIFVKFFNWERLKVPPCGLINCGNSCFANVVLQCLTYTRPLTAYLLEGSHGEECRRSDWCFMCELQDHVWRVRQSQNPFSPIRILSRIRNIGNHLGYGRQEDAHEFMRFAIDSMQSICLDEAGGEKNVDPRTQETTLIHHIFGGHLQSQVKCMQCQHESNRYENMMDLAVEIHGCVETLEDALTQFTAPEWLDGENKYKCDRCSAYVKARKRLTLHDAPNVLTIALKRFQSGKFGKLNKRVTFPEVLDVSSYMSGRGDKPPLYRLYAVVVHVDMLNASFFGHYICYVKDSQGLWYKIDDSKVKEVDLEKVMSQRAYMLFYTRSSARPPPVTEGASPHTVAGAPELGRLCSDTQGSVRLSPVHHQDQNHEIPVVGGAQGLHAMVDVRQMQADGERNLGTETGFAFSNGEMDTHQAMTWQIGRNSLRTSNGYEISADDSECAASSSTLVSPVISNFRSDHAVWFPSQGVVRQVPDPSITEETEYVSWDQKSSLPCEFSEVSLQACDVEKVCTMKVGKRRLEDDLSPLAAPKPLDTDKLPAWPAASFGRPLPASPVLQLLINQTGCSAPKESFLSLSNHDLEKTGESLCLAPSPMQHRISSDQICLPGTREPNEEPDQSLQTQSTNEVEEELVAPAKRQHVEANNEGDRQAKVQMLHENLEDLMDSKPSEAVVVDMDCDASSPQSGPLDPAFHPCLSSVPADLGICLVRNAMHTFPPPLVPVPSEQQVTGLPSATAISDEDNPLSPQRELRGIGMGEKSALQECRAPMQITAASRDPVTSGIGCVFDPGSILSECIHNPDGAPHASLTVEVEDDRALEISSLSSHRVTNNVLEVPLCRLGDAGGEALSVDNVTVIETSMDKGFGHHDPNQMACENLCDVSANLDMAGQTGVLISTSNGPAPDLPSISPVGKVQKSKRASKPLFAPGFLNRVRTPVSDSNAGRLGKSTNEFSTEENVHVNKVGGLDHLGINQQRSHSDVPIVATDVQLPIDANVLGHTCGNSVNCELGNSVLLPGVHRSENGPGTESCEVAAIACDNIVKTCRKIVDESYRKVRPETRTPPGNGVETVHAVPSISVKQEHALGQVQETAAALGQTSLGQPPGGKQKQRRNETCKCGSQRKWKKCCGKSVGIKPEPGRRRLVV